MPRCHSPWVERRGQGDRHALTAPKLVEHFFRHEYARLVAVMVRRSGVQHIAAVEDAVQSALMKALEVWKLTGTPDNPSGWLFRVAQNAFVGELRKRARRGQLLAQITLEDADSPQQGQEHFRGEMQDDLLRMLFVCCDDAIPTEQFNPVRAFIRSCSECAAFIGGPNRRSVPVRSI